MGVMHKYNLNIGILTLLILIAGCSTKKRKRFTGTEV
jgi:hypothetical protein